MKVCFKAVLTFVGDKQQTQIIITRAVPPLAQKNAAEVPARDL